uniref:ATPase H+ transporting accessory protein 1a n=1 Tax=Scatophagus argus TaxID=75038 RepID=UPI001ED85E2B|nr:ATPase H+ transporting accessory protein 1a [Scatophagus argus]XP_046252357.1 ATPase H+ transporting accessory protein 1a [Scatophagus argus]XP_046252358.1 ATPase H+ transporting accessory protein 1a [Scatophagus argus]
MAKVGMSHPNRISASVAVFLGVLSALKAGSCDEQVPLILWTSEGISLPSQPPPTAGHMVGQQQLASYLERALNVGPRNVVLFLQDKMSLEDFTMYGGAFGNKQDSVFPNLEGALTSSSSPLVLPAVSWPASNAVIGQLQDQLETSPLYMDPETLSQLRLNASSPALLVFRLPYGIGADLMSAKEILGGNDEVIGQVLSTMKSQSVPYTAIYTALRPSREAATLSVEAGLGGGRSLLQARGGYRERERERQRRIKEKAGIYGPVEFKEGEDTCILLWAKSLSVSILRRGRWEDYDLTPSTFGKEVSPKLRGSTCDKTKARLVLNYDGVLGYSSFKLIFAMSQRHYRVSARRWFTLDAVELEYNGTKATFNGSRNIYAPAEYSYRCESVTSFRWPLLVPRSSKDQANQWRVSFEDFQIQGFNVTGSEFSYASDCAGFFSPGIWMGLMTSLLMVLVLTYGLHMIMQLHTMDRFDDPKGPAISVPQTE